METSINIVSTASGKKKQKAVTNIDPTATNAELGEFGQMMNALSTNTYVETIRIDKQNVLEAGKTEPILTVSENSYEYNGDGDIFGYAADRYAVSIDRTNKNYNVLDTSGTVQTVYTVTLYATETANFAAKSVTFTAET